MHTNAVCIKSSNGQTRLIIIAIFVCATLFRLDYTLLEGDTYT